MSDDKRFRNEIEKKEIRRIRARGERDNSSVWFGLGMFGLIGWSVAIPTIAAILIGVWLDARWPADFSWTLTLLFAGVIVGCLNAWYWIDRERRR